ncbi:MAG: hypothetical protein RL567_1082 [Bacteroidota bacterium]|jgi:hypothetical protein
MAEDNKKVVKTVNIKLGRQTPIPQNTSAITKPKDEGNGKTK